jgi:recombination protein RecT
MSKIKEIETQNGETLTKVPETLAGLSSKGIRTVLEMYRGEISRLLSNPGNAERVVSIYTNVIRRNLKLMECQTETIIGAVMRATILGLDPNPELGECYFIPRKNNKRGGIMECNFEIGYKGYISMASNTEEISSVSARVVRDNDTFHYEYGLEEKCIHIPNGKSKHKGKLTHCYCIWIFRNGGRYFEVIDEDEILAIKNKSQAKDSEFSPWNIEEWIPDMWRKSVIKKSRKYIPLSSERVKKFIRNMAIDDVVHTTGEFRLGEVLDPDLDKEVAQAEKVPERPSHYLRDTSSNQGSIGDENAQPPD